jgi:ribosomal protein L25 (general stress protein Ctc)
VSLEAFDENGDEIVDLKLVENLIETTLIDLEHDGKTISVKLADLKKAISRFGE